jgi:uncharacterized C2H2 Zn-finger protein
MNPTKNLGLTHRYVDIVRNLEQCSIRLYLQLFVGRLVVYGHSSSRICGGICRVHDQQFVECPHCTSSFTRERDLRRHVSNRHRDINRPTSGGRSGERSRSPIRRSTERPSVRQPAVQDEPQILPDDPETRILYLRHWNTIQTQENSGNRVQDRYNFTLSDITASTFPEIVHRIFRQQTTAFKINMSFGFFLRHMETGELRYHHSSQNNSRFFDVPHLIKTEEVLISYSSFIIFSKMGYLTSNIYCSFWISGSRIHLFAFQQNLDLDSCKSQSVRYYFSYFIIL